MIGTRLLFSPVCGRRYGRKVVAVKWANEVKIAIRERKKPIVTPTMTLRPFGG